ncbi:hypothetical protein Tco_0259157 [Tanacetum coccineum]
MEVVREKKKVLVDECMCSNGNQGDVTIHKRATVNGKAKIVKVVGVVKTRRDIGVVNKWWSLNDGFVCLSTSVLCSSTTDFGNIYLSKEQN